LGFLDTGFRRYDEFAASSGEYNPKGIQNSNAPMLKRNSAAHGLGYLNLDHWILPFDVAQGGELVEPFRISCLGFRIFNFFADRREVTA
jgi:DNA-binding transcriptional LysR family regulator